MKKSIFIISSIIVIVSIFAVIYGCSQLNSIVNTGTQIANTGGQIQAAVDEYKKFMKDDFTDEEKYYVGRSTGAYVFSKTDLLDIHDVTEYVNEVGSTVALASTKPSTFKGYRFGVTIDENPNAYATPGGMILISKGMLKLCETEDELASVLAHEVEHIVKDHPMKAVSNANKQAALIALAKEAAEKAKQSSAFNQVSLPQDLKNELTNCFGNVLGDVFKVYENGYSKETEYEADSGAVSTLDVAGYSVNALKTVIGKLPKPDTQQHNYGSNHPTPEQRITAIDKRISTLKITSKPIDPIRTQRYKTMIAKLK